MHLLHQNPPVVLQPRRCPIGAISSILQTHPGPPLRVITGSGFKNIQRPSNVPSAQSGSHVLTTSDLICEHIPMNDPSFAQSVAKRSPVSMTGNGMKACTVARRSSFAEANWVRAVCGAVVAALHEQTLWEGISGVKPAESASNLCLMRRLQSDSGCSRSR